MLLPFIAEAKGSREMHDQQRRQEKIIQKAYRNGHVTENEYRKLMEEQSIIKKTIELAERDGFWTPDEKKKVSMKLNRAEKRLKRYKNNHEIY
jgi:ATP-dependent protease HslVU (ClpYQ) ATPase subunit